MTLTSAPELAANQHSAHNYSPLPVVLSTGEGAWVTDIDGKRYLDALAGYSALNFGHLHPNLVAVMHDQLQKLTLTSRAFQHDQFAKFCTDLARMTGKDAILPMNTGAEAVETALKAARRWGYEVKGVPPRAATIVVADGNFHGRTTTIVGFSTDAQARSGFGPFTPGFVTVPYGDSTALEAVIDETTVAVLLEPIQGEAGVLIPPAGYLQAVREITRKKEVLFIADEIQSGLGRTGWTFACDRESVEPDIYVLGKALGGGILPVSAIAADWNVMQVFTPGSHGSTFGGNPLACAIGSEVVRLLETGEYQENSRILGDHLAAGLRSLSSEFIEDVRVSGLWAGIEFKEGVVAKKICLAMMERGVLAKDTQTSTVRLAPPLVVTKSEVDVIIDTFHRSLEDCGLA